MVSRMMKANSGAGKDALEFESKRKLADAIAAGVGAAGAGDPGEADARDVSWGIAEIRMVREILKGRFEFQDLPLGQPERLAETHGKINGTWPDQRAYASIAE